MPNRTLYDFFAERLPQSAVRLPDPLPDEMDEIGVPEGNYIRVTNQSIIDMLPPGTTAYLGAHLVRNPPFTDWHVLIVRMGNRTLFVHVTRQLDGDEETEEVYGAARSVYAPTCSAHQDEGDMLFLSTCTAPVENIVIARVLDYGVREVRVCLNSSGNAQWCGAPTNQRFARIQEILNRTRTGPYGGAVAKIRGKLESFYSMVTTGGGGERQPDEIVEIRDAHARSGLSLRLTSFELEVLEAHLQRDQLDLHVLEHYRQVFDIADEDGQVETQGLRRLIATLRDDAGDLAVAALREVTLLRGGGVAPPPPRRVRGEVGHPASGPSEKWGWSGDAAAAYARRFAIRPNPEYVEMNPDCTNFASQCLLAGGKNERMWNPIDYENPGQWFYVAGRASRSWTKAVRLFDHLINHTNSTLATSKMDLRLGDLVIFTPRTSQDAFGHSTVVTGKTSREILVSYHSTNRLDRPYEEVRTSFPAKHYQVHFVKVGTEYYETR